MNAFLAVLVPVGFFGLVALSVLYVDVRLRRLFGWRSKRRTRGVGAAAVFGALAAIGAGASSASPVAGAGYLVGGYVFTVYLYLLLTLAGLDLLGMVFSPPSGVLATMALALPVALTVIGAFQAGKLVVNETHIQLPKLARPMSVMLVSDVHLGHHRGRDYLASLVTLANAHRPDLVLIAGDLVDANVALDPTVLAPLRDLQAPAYYVDGNHEKEIDRPRALKLIAQHGIRVLHNDIVRADGLQLIGLDYMKADDDAFDMHPSTDPRTIASTLAAMPLQAGMPTILMHHSPVGTHYAEAAGVDLMVAGHTHAGQLFPGTLINAAIFPFNRGLYEKGKLKVFVSAGAGTFLQRIRLGSVNEINLLRLDPS